MSALLVSGLGALPAAAQDPGRAPNRYPVTNITQLCADLGSRILRYDSAGSCDRGEEQVQLRVSERVAVCSTGDRRVRQIGASACERRGGRADRIPAPEAVFLCADRARDGRLRGTPKPSLCHDEVERALRSRNLAPTDLVLDDRTVTENVPIGTAVGSFVARDPDAGDRHVFRLVPGAGSHDNAAFSVAGGVLRTRAAVDAETQASYRIRVRATDILGRSRTEPFLLTVVDVDENADPTDISLTPGEVAENQPGGAAVGTLTTTDPDAGETHSYTLVTEPGVPNDNASFEIAGDSLRTLAALDHEAGDGTLTVRVSSDDGNGGTVEEDLSVTVTDENDAPTALALAPATVPENDATAVVGTLSTTDQDPADSHTYTLVAGPGDADNALFAISGDELATAAALDFEDRAGYSVRVRTTDGDASFEQVLTVTATDANDAPSQVLLSPASVAENAPAGTSVGALAAEDQDTADSHTFALVSGTGDTDNAAFEVVGSELRTAQSFDYEAKASYSVRIAATDGDAASVATALVVTVTNDNDQPTQLDLSSTSVVENAPSGTAVGTLSTLDQDAPETHTYTLVAGTGDDDNAVFTVVGDELRTATGFDFEADSALTVRVRSTDAGGATVERDFAIAVTDVNEAPTDLDLSPSAVPENSPVGTAVGALAGSDPDAGDALTYSLVAGAGSADNADFTIVGSELRTAVVLDHEARSTYSVRVRVTDGGTPGLTFEEQLTVTVADVDETATEITLTPATIAENQPAGTAVGTLSADDPDAGASLTFTLVAGVGDDDNAAFSITGTSLNALQTFDAEVKATYSIRVSVDDGTAPPHEQQLTVTVTDANDAPTDLVLSDDHVAENAPVGTAVGTLSTTDQDAADTHAYSLVSGTGDDDNASFAVVDDELRTAAVLDRETDPTLSVRVSSADGHGGTIAETLTITVDNENEAPSTLTLDATSLPENTAPYDVGELAATDPDSTAPFTFTLAAGTGDADNGDFTVSGTTLRATTAADYEQDPTRSVRLRVTDAGGAFHEEAFTITVVDGNDAPSGVLLTPATVAENAASGTTIGDLTTSDEATDTATFTLISGAGDTDNGLVAVDGDTLEAAAVLDHETTPTLSVRVRVTDGSGLTDERALTITVTDVNEAPTGLALSATSVAENEPAGALVGTLSVNDPDVGDSVSYALVAGTGDADNGLFVVDGDRLETSSALDHEAQGTRSVRVRATDAAGEQAFEVFTITVTNVNEAPTGPTLTGTTVDENRPAGTVVGDLGSNDPDVGDTATYALVSGAGDADNGSFRINGATGALETDEALDFEADAERTVRVSVTDAGGLTSVAQLTVTVLDVNDAPVANADALSGAIGNTQAKRGAISTTGPVVTLTGSLPLANDTDQDAGDTISVVPATGVATSRGGTVDIGADGAFRFVPKAGDQSLTDTFSYSVTDGEETTVGTVSVAIGSRRIWWVDDGAGGTPDGRSTSPYASLTPLQGAGDPDDTGDEIFVYAGSYTSGIPLEANQKLIGEGVGLEGLVPLSGTRPIITVGAATGVALANGSSVDGLDITSSGTGNAVLANAVTAATVGSTMTVTGATGDAVRITGAAGGDITVSATVLAGGTGRAASVENRSSGTVTFDGAVRSNVATTGGVFVNANSASTTVRFTGGVQLSTGTAAGFTAQSGGSVVVTGAANTLASTSGTPLTVSGTTIAGDGVTFRSISSTGAVNGIRLENTGTAGRLVVAGNSSGDCGGRVNSAGVVTAVPSSGDCTGGTISGSTGAGVRLVNTNAPSLTRLWIRNGGDDGISASGVTGGLTVASSLVESNGNAGAEDGIALGDSSSTSGQGATGTLAVTNTTVRRSGDVNVFLGNTSGTAALNVSGSQIHGAGTAGVTRDGVLALAYGSAAVAASVTATNLEDNLGDQVQVSSGGTGATTATIRNNQMRITPAAVGALGGGVTVSSAQSPWSGSMQFDIGSNTITGAVASAVAVSETLGTAGSTFSGFVRNNAIGTSTLNSCSATADGITIANDGGSGTMVVSVTDNAMQQCFDRGMALIVGDGGPTMEATVTGNSVSSMPATSSNGLHANFGITSADTGTSCFDAANNTLSFGPLATTGLRLRHRFAPLELPGYTGGTTDTTAVRNYLVGRHPSSTVAVDTPLTGTFTNGGASCATPS